MEEWIDIKDRLPREGEIILLPGIKDKYEVSGTALYNKGRLAIPLSIVEKYKIADG